MRGGGGRIQGNANYNLGGSMFDAAPYPLNGRVREEPDYVQQRYGSSFGGPLTIPHVYNGGTRTSFFLNYSATIRARRSMRIRPFRRSRSAPATSRRTRRW